MQNLVCNCVAIPLWGADGAAGVALSSALLMTVLTVWAASGARGGLAVVRAFGGPVLAGAALVAAALLAPLPAIPAGALACSPTWAWWWRSSGRSTRQDVRAYLSVASASRRRRGRVAA